VPLSLQGKCAPSPASGGGLGWGCSRKKRAARSDRFLPPAALWRANCGAERVDLPRKRERWRSSSPSHLEKFPQQRRSLSLADGRIDFRDVMAGRGCKEPHAGFHRASFGIGRAVIKPPDPRQRDRARAHRTWLQRDVEVAIDQPLCSDDFGRLSDCQDFRVRGRIAVGQGLVAGSRDHLVVSHNHAANRDLAGVSGIFGGFQRQIHERGRGHTSYHRNKPAMRGAFSKSGYRFARECASMLFRRARD